MLWYIEAVVLLTSLMVGSLLLMGTTRVFHVVHFVNNLSISFNSCAIVSCIAGIMLAVFVIFFYGKQRKMLKEGGGYTQTSQPENIPEAQKEE